VEVTGDALHLAETREEVTLTIDRRQPARALITSITHNLGAEASDIVLTGNGPYPAGRAE
jgi:hypothetical protein